LGGRAVFAVAIAIGGSRIKFGAWSRLFLVSGPTSEALARFAWGLLFGSFGYETGALSQIFDSRTILIALAFVARSK